VHSPPPATLGDNDIARGLTGTWALEFDDIRYVERGGGSYHWIAEVGRAPAYFITVDDLDTKPWMGGRRDATFEGLAAAYEAALALRNEAALAFVVGPLRCPRGSTILRMCDQYSMAVFPFVAGHFGTWGDDLTDSVRGALLQELATLHQATPLLVRGVAPRSLDLPERPLLAAALGALDRPWEGGPFSEPARLALAHHARDVTGWLEQLDVLASRIEGADGAAVLTHGEPHPGNVIQTSEGLRLVDWDTVAWARPERDLWMLDDGSPEGLVRYEDLTGRAVSDTAISFYRLAWTLSDIASLADRFRARHEESEWNAAMWSEFERLLGGSPSAPYYLA
jgi:spectinomycin phosphotransferase